jgi:ABC-type Mn2+/Zn2+ transport system permease subunit
VRTGVTELVFNLLVAAVVIASVRVLGVLLIAAAVVIPAATARLLISSFGRLLVVSTALGAAVSVAGLYLSFYVDVPSGATIVLVGAGLFTVVALGTAVTGRSRLARARQAHAGLLSAAVGEAPAAAQGAGRPPGPPTGR